MYPSCNTACVNSTTLTKLDICPSEQRSEVVVRYLTAKCDFTFPTGLYTANALATALVAAITNGEVSATPELSNVEWSDPTTATKLIGNRTRPAKNYITGRTLTARDYNAFDVDGTGASVPYNDRIIYLDEIQAPSTRIVGYVTADGKIYLFLDAKGAFLPYSANFFTGFDNEIDGQTIEYKNYVLNFVGDPLARLRTPYLDIIQAGGVAQLGWLYQSF